MVDISIVQWRMHITALKNYIWCVGGWYSSTAVCIQYVVPAIRKLIMLYREGASLVQAWAKIHHGQTLEWHYQSPWQCLQPFYSATKDTSRFIISSQYHMPIIVVLYAIYIYLPKSIIRIVNYLVSIKHYLVNCDFNVEFLRPAQVQVM